MTRLVVVIAAAGAAAPLPPAPFMPTTPLPVDAEGHRYLPDHGRPLPAGIARVLTQVPLDASASAFTFTVLGLSGRGGKPPQRNTTGADLGARQPRPAEPPRPRQQPSKNLTTSRGLCAEAGQRPHVGVVERVTIWRLEGK